MMASAPYVTFCVVFVTYLALPTQSYVPVHERPVVPAAQERSRLTTRVEEPLPSISQTRTSSNRGTGKTPSIVSRASQLMFPGMLGNVIRRVSDLESDNEDLASKYDHLHARTSLLTGQIRDLHTQVSDMSSNNVASLRSSNQALEMSVANLEAQNEQLQSILLQFERFFNQLISNDPASFDPNAAPEQRLSRLQQYLGNAEAELIGMGIRTVGIQTSSDDVPPVASLDVAPSLGGMGAGSTFGISSVTSGASPSKNGQSRSGTAGVQTNSTTPANTGNAGVYLSEVEADHLAAALEQLSAQNRELATRMQTVEQETRTVQNVGTQSFTSSGTAVTNELLDKIDRLEQVVALQASTILDGNTFGITDTAYARADTNSRRLQTSFGVSSASATGGGATAMNTDDVEIMRDVLRGARSGSSSRKSAFSVARTSPLLGGTIPKQVEFDHVYVNKGRDFMKNNSTFVCEMAGYYFITFNLRSYDDRYLGVTLMKNDEVVTAVFTDANSRNVMESQSVIVHLETGDNIWLRLGPSERFGLHSDTYKYVTFSGFMIYSGY